MGLMNGRILDSVLKIEFRDTNSRNSFSLRAAEELRELCESQMGNYRSILFTGPGRVFCSGGNLADYAAMTMPDPGKEVNRRISDVLDMFANLSVPTVCAVQGDCFGGGLELLSTFDLVLSSPISLFGVWQRKVGLTFGWGGGARLEKRLGAQKLKQLALSSATIGAVEALRIGMIDGIFVESLLVEQAYLRARRMQELPKNPVAAIKSRTPENEQGSFEELWWNEEHRAVLNLRKN